jgi:hypothetical protein
MGRFQNNPSIGWVHRKSAHARPLTWGNKNLHIKVILNAFKPIIAAVVCAVAINILEPGAFNAEF